MHQRQRSGQKNRKIAKWAGWGVQEGVYRGGTIRLVFFLKYFLARIFLRATPHFIAIGKRYKMMGHTQKNTVGKAVFDMCIWSGADDKPT